MSKLTVSNLGQKDSYFSEINLSKLRKIKGGVIPIAVGIAAGSAFVAGLVGGITLYDVTHR